MDAGPVTAPGATVVPFQKRVPDDRHPPALDACDGTSFETGTASACATIRRDIRS